MDDDQIKACRELIRVARIVATTLRGLWFYSAKNSQAEAVLSDIEARLYEAADAANVALSAKVESTVQVH